MANKKVQYDWKITAKKFGWALAQVLVAGVLVVITERGEWLFLVPALEALRNYLKHR